jgi:photosystem II stability/assembly factor-like uncharacterized protein
VVSRPGGRRSTDGGASFRAIDPTIAITRWQVRLRTAKLSSFDISNGAELAGRAIFAFGSDGGPPDLYSDGVLESTDDGTHWSLVPRLVPREAVDAISFVSPTIGYESSDGGLCFTRNRVRSWSKIRSLGSNTEPIFPPANLSFSSPRDGYALVNFARRYFEPTLLRTEDGGRSWTPEQLRRSLVQVVAAGAVDYAGAEDDGPIFETTRGGLSSNRSTIRLAIAGPRRLSVAKLKRAGGRVRLVGKLSPEQAGQTVVISYPTAHHFLWHHITVTTNSRGAFALAVAGIGASTDFVAQYGGDDQAGGTGTPAVRLTVTHAKRLRKGFAWRAAPSALIRGPRQLARSRESSPSGPRMASRRADPGRLCQLPLGSAMCLRSHPATSGWLQSPEATASTARSASSTLGVGFQDQLLISTNSRSATHAQRLFPSGSGWFFASRTSSTAALSTKSG